MIYIRTEANLAQISTMPNLSSVTQKMCLNLKDGRQLVGHIHGGRKCSSDMSLKQKIYDLLEIYFFRTNVGGEYEICHTDIESWSHI